MEMNYFRGDLTDIWVKKEALVNAWHLTPHTPNVYFRRFRKPTSDLFPDSSVYLTLMRGQNQTHNLRQNTLILRRLHHLQSNSITDKFLKKRTFTITNGFVLPIPSGLVRLTCAITNGLYPTKDSFWRSLPVDPEDVIDYCLR